MVRSVGNRWRRVATLLLTGGVTLAACSGAGGDDEIVDLTTTSGETTTTAVVTTTTSVTTTTGEPSTTTAPPETTTSTTTVEQLAAEIQADLQAGRDAFSLQMADPANADIDLLRTWYTDDGLSSVEQLLADLVANAQAVRQGPGPLDDITVVSVEPLDPATALVVYCLTNDAVVVEAATGQVINDDVGTFTNSRLVHREDGVWRSDTAERLNFARGTTCVP